MNDTVYAKTLKRIVLFAQIKYGLLAEAIGYDVSYISKWITGARLPAAKNMDVIHQDIGKFLAEIFIKEHREKEFCHTFGLPEISFSEELSFQIAQILCRAYRVSVRVKQPLGNNAAAISEFIFGKSDCQKVLHNLLVSLEDNPAPLSMAITGELCNLGKNHFWQQIRNLNIKKQRCTIHVGLDLQLLEQRTATQVEVLYTCLDSLLNCNFYIHEGTFKAYQNIIVVEDRFALAYWLDGDGYIDVCMEITDAVQVRAFYNKCKAYLMTCPVLILPKDTLGMERFGYRDTFFTSQRFFYFLTNGFEFLLPDEVFISLSEKVRSGEVPAVTEEWVRRIFITWKKLMDKAELKFILPTNTIIRYLETGYIHLTDLSYKLSKEERRLHLEQILKVMQENPKISLGFIVPTSGLSYTENICNLSFYSNYSTAFFKKNLQAIVSGVAPIYLIENPILIQCFHKFFEGLKQLPCYKEYSAEELQRLYDRYQYLLDFLN